MTNEDKLYADKLRNKALSDYERLNLAINELEETEQVHTSHHGVQMFPKGVFTSQNYCCACGTKMEVEE